jgi:hypothetical protein
MRVQNGSLVDRFAEVGIDWSPAPAEGASEGTPRAVIDMQVGSPTGVLPVGEKTPLILTVTNAGDAPFHRLRAMAESELISGKEFIFGRVDPGETRTWTVHLEPGLRMSSRTDEVTFEFFADGSRAPGDFAGKLMIEEKPRPRFAYNYQVIDDGSGGSKGNGDGLVQPGEAIDLLVTVQNIGEGPTGDQVSTFETTAEWFPGHPLETGPVSDPFLDTPEDARSGLPGSEPDRSPDLIEEDGTVAAAGEAGGEEEPRSSGFIRLNNESGKDVFLTEGSAEFSLAPGEMTRARLHFDVSDELLGDALEMTVVIGDDEFWEFFEDDLELPLAYTVGGEPPSASVPPLSKVMRTRGVIAVRSGAAADAPRIATADGAVQTDGKLASWVRVALPWGGHGWIDSGDLKGGGGATPSDEVFLPWISRSPPVVLLASRIGGTAVDAETVQLSGVVRDDQAVKDLFIFVNGTKVFYRSVDGAGGTTPDGSVEFECAVGLEEGDNTIEVFARDNDDLMGSTTVGVYRTQGAETAMQ